MVIQTYLKLGVLSSYYKLLRSLVLLYRLLAAALGKILLWYIRCEPVFDPGSSTAYHSRGPLTCLIYNIALEVAISFLLLLAFARLLLCTRPPVFDSPLVTRIVLLLEVDTTTWQSIIDDLVDLSHGITPSRPL